MNLTLLLKICSTSTLNWNYECYCTMCQTLCLTLIGCQYKKCLTKDYMESIFIKKLQKEIQGGLERNVSKSSRAGRPGLAASGISPDCSCCSARGLEATLAPARRMRWLSVKSKRPCTGSLILGSSPATFSLHQLSCQPLCTPASPGRARRDSPAQKKDGGKAGSLD